MSFGEFDRSHRRLRGMLHRGHIVRQSNENDRRRWDISTVEGSAYTEVEDTQHVGWASNPGAGDNVEVIVAELGAETSRMVILTKFGDSEKILQVEAGQMAIYSPANKDHAILIDGDGNITIKGAPGKTTVEAKTVIIKSDDINLGGEGGKPVAIEGTKTSDGATLVSSFSTKVKAI